MSTKASGAPLSVKEKNLARTQCTRKQWAVWQALLSLLTMLSPYPNTNCAAASLMVHMP